MLSGWELWRLPQAWRKVMVACQLCDKNGVCRANCLILWKAQTKNNSWRIGLIKQKLNVEVVIVLLAFTINQKFICFSLISRQEFWSKLLMLSDLMKV